MQHNISIYQFYPNNVISHILNLLLDIITAVELLMLINDLVITAENGFFYNLSCTILDHEQAFHKPWWTCVRNAEVQAKSCARKSIFRMREVKTKI